MFTFAIWDNKKKSCSARATIFGIKPFYYAQDAGTLLFGSEIKSFLDHPGFKRS